jgi:hypothetical protein
VDLVCARSASCAADHRHASDDLAWLAERLRRHPVDGTGIDAVGNAHALHVTEGFLADRIPYNDGGAFVSDAELAAAATSLRLGDAVPLLRLAADADGPFFGDNGEPSQFSAGESAARVCIDATFAWDKGAPIGVRRRQFERARDQLGRNTFAPFSVDGWLSSPPDGLQPDPCIVWPTPEPGTQPAVPPRPRFSAATWTSTSAPPRPGTSPRCSRRAGSSSSPTPGITRCSAGARGALSRSSRRSSPR